MIKDSTQQQLGPNPALRSLDRLVGTWQVSGEAQGQVTVSWMAGDFFLIQTVDLDGGARGTGFIGYEADSRSLKSHYFNNTGDLLEYTYQVDDHTHTVSVDMPGRKGQFVAQSSEGGNTLTGRWDWIQDSVEKGYDATMTRVN